MWGFASEGFEKEQRRSAAERKAKQSHTPAPQVRHRTHSPAQRTRPPQAKRRAHREAGGKRRATTHVGKDKNVGTD